MLTLDEKRRTEAEALYQQYGKPLEQTHNGQYVAIAKNGATVVGASVLDVMQKANVAFGPGSYVFKIGERAVGKWR